MATTATDPSLARIAPTGHVHATRRHRDLSSIAVEQDGHRAVIDQLDVHHGLKFAGGHRQGRCAQFSHEILIQRASELGWRGTVEGRPASPPHVAIQRELRHHEHSAADVDDGSIHWLVVFALEQTCVPNLAGDVSHLFRAIVTRDAKQHEQAVPNLADDAIADTDACFGYALNNGTHGA